MGEDPRIGQITEADPGSAFGPAWSPDGRYIAFARASAASNGIYLVPAMGGSQRKLADANTTANTTREANHCGTPILNSKRAIQSWI